MEKLINWLKISPALNYFVRVFKKDKEGAYPTSTNIKIMHGINRISIVMFLIALTVMIWRAFFRQ